MRQGHEPAQEAGGSDSSTGSLANRIYQGLEDEHDQEDWLEEVISEDEYRFSARIDIDYLIEEYDLKITPGEEYETLGGLILHHLESIPEAGTKIDIDDLTFDIEKVSDNRIEVVRIIK